MDGERQIHLQILLEALPLLFIHDVMGDAGHFARQQRRFIKRLENALEFGTRRRAGGEVEVGTILAGQDLQHLIKIHVLLTPLVSSLKPSSCRLLRQFAHGGFMGGSLRDYGRDTDNILGLSVRYMG